MRLAEILGAMGVVIGVAIFLILSIRFLATSDALKHFTAADGRVLLNYFTIAVSAHEPVPHPSPPFDASRAVQSSSGAGSWEALSCSAADHSGARHLSKKKKKKKNPLPHGAEVCSMGCLHSAPLPCFSMRCLQITVLVIAIPEGLPLAVTLMYVTPCP